MSCRILGIDPGIAILGYGVVLEEGGELFNVDYGCLTTPPSHATAERLRTLYWGLLRIVEAHRPTEMAIELFVARNLKTALAVGQARGVAILAAANSGIPVHEYTPTQVKQRVSGFGRGDKRQIQEMVRMQLRLECIPRPDDAADALAVAICHATQSRLARIIGGGR